MKHLHWAALAVATICVSGTASANPFAYNYGAETAEKGETEVAAWATQRDGRRSGDYRARDIEFEIEHGFTDRTQGALYLTFETHRGDDLRWNGAKAEFVTTLVKPDAHKLGVALYIEPAYSRFAKGSGERQSVLSLETKLLLERRFGDRLTWVGNATLEQEFERDDHRWNPELEAELSTGLAYRVAGRVTIGGEGRWTNVFAGFPNVVEREKWALFAGPTIHYDGGEWFATLSHQVQLAGGPGGGARNLDGFERHETRLKLGVEF